MKHYSRMALLILSSAWCASPASPPKEPSDAGWCAQIDRDNPGWHWHLQCGRLRCLCVDGRDPTAIHIVAMNEHAERTLSVPMNHHAAYGAGSAFDSAQRTLSVSLENTPYGRMGMHRYWHPGPIAARVVGSIRPI